MSATTVERAHERARRTATGRLYAAVRILARAILHLWFRVGATGLEHLPEQGPAILAANHKSFLDAFFIGIATRRRVRTMAKASLFHGPLGRLLVPLGAFPVRRGTGDVEALTTARAILEQGGVLIVFPEGTRVDEPDALGSPHHGAGRIAMDSGAPIIPVAIHGTSHLWLGPVPKPRRVDVAFLEPVAARPGGAEDARAALEDLIDRRVWPAVQLEYGRLHATPGVIAVALSALGLGGLAMRRRSPAAELPRLLGVVQPRAVRRRRRLAALGRRILRR